MGKLSTRKKFTKKPQPQIPRDVTNATTAYIKQWTRQELGKLQKDRDTSICIPTKNGYRIGLYTLHVYPNKTCDVRNHHDVLVHTFENKISAVLYTIYTIKNQHWLADQLLALDTEINKNYTDMLVLKRSLEQAIQLNDYIRIDIRKARLEIAQGRLNIAREKVLKLHRTAKFNKVWE